MLNRKTNPESKLKLHLKLGRKLVQFIKIDAFFESKTFDWLQLEQNQNCYRATLIRSFDEGDEFFDEVQSFTTLNNLDEANVLLFEGNLHEVLQWAKETVRARSDGFYLPEGLKSDYREMLERGQIK